MVDSDINSSRNQLEGIDQHSFSDQVQQLDSKLGEQLLHSECPLAAKQSIGVPFSFTDVAALRFHFHSAV